MVPNPTDLLLTDRDSVPKSANVASNLASAAQLPFSLNSVSLNSSNHISAETGLKETFSTPIKIA